MCDAPKSLDAAEFVDSPNGLSLFILKIECDGANDFAGAVFLLLGTKSEPIDDPKMLSLGLTLPDFVKRD
jgi:hypothetical protein